MHVELSGWMNSLCALLGQAPAIPAASQSSDSQIKLKDWIEIAAIFLGPFTALLVQRYFDGRHEVRRQQENLYATLMRLRAASLTPDYVNALNLIDVTFNRKNKSERQIREKWKVLMDHFSNPQSNEWEKNRQDLTVDLLAAIGGHLGYKFDPSHIKSQVYFPVALSEQWSESNQLRKRLLEVLDGRGTRKIPVAIFETKFPETK